MRRYLIPLLLVCLAMIVGMKSVAEVADYIYSDSGTIELMDNTKIGDDKTFTFGADDDVTVQYDEDGDNDLQISGGGVSAEGGAVVPAQETLTNSDDGGSCTTYGSTTIDSSGGKVDFTLGDPTLGSSAAGVTKTITTSDGSTASDLTITHHETADSEQALFDATDEYLRLVWTGTEWATVSNSCTFP